MNHSRDKKENAKRRKITVACDDCRARKVRCDGVQPVCGPCSRRSDHTRCVYTGDIQKKRETQTYITRLEDRIQQLERSRNSDPNPISLIAQTPHRTDSSWSPADSNAEATGDGARKAPGQPQSRLQLGPDSGGDGVNAMMGAVEEGRATQGFFGSSSAAGFMRQIQTAVDQRVSSPDRRSPGPTLALRSDLSSERGSAPRAPPDYVLPPRRTADCLMDVYWNYVFPLYPFVDSAQMKVHYTPIWEGGTSVQDESMRMCTFNVIFALASQLADFIPAEEREGAADAFFARAKDLLHFNLWDTGSAGLIQCLLLMAQYLQSTDSAHQCWIVTGLAIRNAQSLGLHLAGTIARLRGLHEQQLARKLWHGCVLMDRVIAMTFGRPAMISRGSNGAVPLPMAVDDELFLVESPSEPTQPTNQPSIMTFFAKTLELYEIMNEVLLSLYKPVSEDGAGESQDFLFNDGVGERGRTIFDLDRSLTRWASNLPSHLRGSPSVGTDNPVLDRQRIVLHARFLHVRILLFRPTLSKYCAMRDDDSSHSFIPISDSFPHRVALQCSVICVRVAQESIQLIYDNVPADGTGGPLPAWWYNILYVYTAATVLIAGHLCPLIVSELTEASLTHSWNCALGVLRKYQSYSKSARRCVAALEILYEQVMSEGQLPIEQNLDHDLPPQVPCGLSDMSFGEGMSAAMMEGLGIPDLQDMSWLNSVPSNLF